MHRVSSSPRKTTVIGAGVVGVATAYAFSSRGDEVTIIDGRANAGLGTSFANGGQLSYLYTGPLANHRIRKEIPGLALGFNPAFRIKANPDPDFILWLLSFLRNCTRDRYLRNSRRALEIALESHVEMLKLLQVHNLDFDYQVRGKMQMLYTDAAVEAIKENMGLKGLKDEDQELLSIEGAAKLEPALNLADDKPKAVLFTPSEAVGDANKFSQALLHTLTSEYGVTSRFETRVTDVTLKGESASVETDAGDMLNADLVVLCTGADRKLLKKLGIRVPVFPMKGYSITAPMTENSPAISLTDSKRRLVFTRLGDRMRIAGMADLGWTSEFVDPKRLDVLLTAAKASMPLAADFDNATQHWAGLRPMTPDSVPRSGRPHPALAYNLGHGMLGWTMAMGAGKRLADMVGV